MRDEIRISLPAKPTLIRTTLGQLCTAPWASRSRPAVTEPGLEPRVSGGTASTCSALAHCSTQEARVKYFLPDPNLYVEFMVLLMALSLRSFIALGKVPVALMFWPRYV